VVNLAARLQSKAGAGEVLISEESLSKASGDFPGARSEQVTAQRFSRADKSLPAERRTAARLVSDPPDSIAQNRTSIGADYLRHSRRACAVVTLIGPLAVAVGAGGVFGLAGALTFPRSERRARAGPNPCELGRNGKPLHALACAQAETRSEDCRANKNHDDARKTPHDFRSTRRQS
jgi:hypothetical protein